MPGGEGENRVGEGIQSLKQLHALPWDEKTENEMLRSRLDEQSQLICMLKQRADETQIKWQHLERVNGELERQSGEAAQRFQSERERGERLEERFAILASNHQQMIRFKDEYKQQNEELRQLCDTMRESKYPELLHRDRCIQELRDQLGDTETRLKEQEMNYGRKLDTLKAKVEQLEGEKRTGSLELGDLTHRLKVSEETRHEAQEKLARLEEIKKAEKAEADRRLEEIKKEKQELLNLCMERGRTLQDRQREAAELSVRLQEAQKSLEKAEESYQRDKAAVDADIRVSDLQRKLEDGENQFEQLRRDFEAYKKHSGDLLTKERELNSKLRHLIG
nr:Bc8 orange interacting protein [Xenopus laevis]